MPPVSGSRNSGLFTNNTIAPKPIMKVRDIKISDKTGRVKHRLSCFACIRHSKKKRINICGKPAVPNIRAKPSEIADTGSETSPPGDIIPTPLLCTLTALTNNVSNEKFILYITAIAMKLAPDNKSTALMICTQVVARHAAKCDIHNHQHPDDHNREVIFPDQTRFELTYRRQPSAR